MANILHQEKGKSEEQSRDFLYSHKSERLSSHRKKSSDRDDFWVPKNASAKTMSQRKEEVEKEGALFKA